MANNTDTIYSIMEDIKDSITESLGKEDEFVKTLEQLIDKDNQQNETEQNLKLDNLKTAAQKYLKQTRNIQNLIAKINENTENQNKLINHIRFRKNHPNISNIQNVINKAAQMLFVETTLFEDNVNRFIKQYPIQIFVLSGSNGEFGAFSYDTKRKTLERVADTANMSLSGTTIKFNMTFEKAKQIVNNVISKSTGKIGELLDFSDEKQANFVSLNKHQENLKKQQKELLKSKVEEFKTVLATQTAVSDSEEFKNVAFNSESRSVINDLLAASKKGQSKIQIERLKKLHNILTQLGINFTIKQQEQSLSLDNVKLKYVLLKNIEINRKNQIKRFLYTKKGEVNKWDEGYLKALNDAGVKGVYEYEFSNDSKSSFKVKVNQGQLKEGFFGYYYGLEQGETEINYQNQVYTVNRDSYVGYLTAMDNVKARLWGDYNIKHGKDQNEKNYAISLKSENAGMDIKQFQGLATMIINKCNTSEIKNETDLKKFIIDIQKFDVQQGHIQNSAFLQGMGITGQAVAGDEMVMKYYKQLVDKTLETPK